MKLSDLTEKRRAHVLSCKKNNDNSHKVIANQYSKRAHFIYELLQNADDAGASQVLFNLRADSLEFQHDGEKLFNFEDVDSITAIGSSTKKDKINKIGTFGAGFKSVFSVTKTPKIYSGNYNFQISDFIVPKEIKAINKKEHYTIICLPFNRKSKPKKVREKISCGLNSLQPEALLFLNNIQKIQWKIGSNRENYHFTEIKEHKVSLISQVNGEDNREDYLLFKRPLKIDDIRLNISVAYKINSENDNSLVPTYNSKIFVFFPTTVTPGFNFFVHAPYKTTPNRETIPLEDDEQNRIITNELAICIADSIQFVKDKGFLDVNFLSMLPIDPENDHPVYSPAFQKVKEILSTSPLLPDSIKGYTNAKDALLAKGKELTTLLNHSDCYKLFGKNIWLSTNITSDRTKELKDYLTDILDIPEITMEKFCQEITDDFMMNKTDKWIVNFYSTLINQESLYRKSDYFYKAGILRKKTIIRLENNAHVCPENEDGDLWVYLPTNRNSEFKTVKEKIAENESAYEFLQKLGLEIPDGKSEIQEFIIPKYKNGNIDIKQNEYIRDFEKVLGIWLSAEDENKKREIIDMIKDVNFIGSTNYDQDFSLRKPAEVYHPTEKLKMWFKDNTSDEIHFLADCLQVDDNRYKKLLEPLNIGTKPNMTGKDPYRGFLRGNIHVKGLSDFNPEFSIEGLEFSIDNINIDRSFYIFYLALKYFKKLTGTVVESSRQDFDPNGWHYCEEEKPSIAGKLLLDKNWLYDKEKKLIKKPLSEILLEELHDDYQKKHENIEHLIRQLGFKSDQIRKFEEEHGVKCIPREQYLEYEEWKAEKIQNNQQNQENSWAQEIDAEEAKINIDDSSGQRRAHKDFSNQKINENTNSGGEYEKDNHILHSPHNRKEIGEWGERYANRFLIKKYPDKEVIWLNESQSVGKGYDFLVKDNDADIAYYEVKSKTDEAPQFFKVSGAQWDWAQRLYNEGKGDMYKLLLVSNAGKKTKAKIKEITNPVAQWKKGELYATPVNIEL